MDAILYVLTIVVICCLGEPRQMLIAVELALIIAAVIEDVN